MTLSTDEYSYYKDAQETAKRARRISRSQLRAYSMGLLKTKQGGNCAVCGKPIDLTVSGHNSAIVADHCHDTGLIRGILHRGCNGALGKLENAVGRWTGIGMNYDKIIPWLEQALVYYKSGFEPVIYPDHKTVEEKQAAQKQKVNRAAALKRAKLKLQKERDGS